jgi:hypothetical protein
MRNDTIEKLQYFLGKVCTVMTSATGRSLNEKQAREHFVVRVQEINQDGIWGSHPRSDVISFFSQDHIVSIHEEFELDPNNPEHKAMIEEFEKQTGKPIQSDIGPIVEKTPPPPKEGAAAFIDVKKLKGLAEETKQANQIASMYPPLNRLPKPKP